MHAETDLDRLIAGMAPRLVEGVWVFASVPHAAAPDPSTLVLPLGRALALGLRHDFPCRMITLDVHSSLAATGFLARITAALAARGMAVNPVSGFFHDHLFVPDGREAEALAMLRALSGATAAQAADGAGA